MASQTGKKIRLVKCPKCLKILQEDEDVPIYQCGGCSAILQAKRRSISSNSTAPSVEETQRVQANEPRSEPETNNVSSSSGHGSVLPSSQGGFSAQENEKKGSTASMESMEKELGALELSNGDETNEIQQQECSVVDAEKNEEEDNFKIESDMMTTVGEVAGSGASSGSLSVEHVVATRASDSSGIAEISPDTPHVEMKQSQLDVVAARSSDSSGNVEISPDTSPFEKKQTQLDVVAARSSDSSGNVEISPDASPVEEKQSQLDDPTNKTSSAYDGSESSSDAREDQIFDENEEWNALQRIRSDKFEMHRYPGNYKEEGSSSSSTFFKNRRNGISTTYNERYQNMSVQQDGPRGVLGSQGRRHVTEQLRPDIPFYPREPSYTRGSPSYPSYDELDRYSRAHSLQMYGGINPEFVDYIYQNNPRARGRGQRGWYSAQLHHNSYSSHSASPQRLMEPRWSHEIVSDVEDHHQRNRYVNHHHELQSRGLKGRPPVAKRHVRPTAGGAPFVTCYSCSEHLHLPVDFLIFKKKHHLLRCSTCSTVLRFKLQSRTHLVPAIPHNINGNSTSESPREKAPSVQDNETPEAKSSTLHLLMGYSTVSQVFKASKRPSF